MTEVRLIQTEKRFNRGAMLTRLLALLLILASIANTVWDKVNMDKLTVVLLSVIEETMQPEKTSL